VMKVAATIRTRARGEEAKERGDGIETGPEGCGIELVRGVAAHESRQREGGLREAGMAGGGEGEM